MESVNGQKQAKNGPKTPETVFFSRISELLKIFWPIILNPVRTKSNIVLASFRN